MPGVKNPLTAYGFANGRLFPKGTTLSTALYLSALAKRDCNAQALPFRPLFVYPVR